VSVARLVIQLPDEQLLARPDAGAFAELYARHGEVVLRVAGRVCGPALAEAAAQDTFVSAWRASELFDSRQGTVRSWLLAIARRRAIDQLRRGRSDERQRDHREEALMEVADTCCVEDAVVVELDGAAVRGALHGLPEAQRRVLELAYFAGLSHGEIAAVLELPLGTVKGRIRLGLERLRSLLGHSAVADAA
jgi:RNA polymerase sigma-70 factor, ECF subfamily